MSGIQFAKDGCQLVNDGSLLTCEEPSGCQLSVFTSNGIMVACIDLHGLHLWCHILQDLVMTSRPPSLQDFVTVVRVTVGHGQLVQALGLGLPVQSLTKDYG